MTSPTGDGAVVWLTGIPASGKTTVALVLNQRLRAAGRVTLWLDSDEVRKVLTPKPTYSDDERDWFYASLAFLARLGAEGGATVIVSATAHRRVYRERARAQVDRFVEVWLRLDPAVAAGRDPKGLYRMARDKAIDNLPGSSATFEAPAHPELVFDTTQDDVEAIVDAIVATLGG